MLLVSFLPAEFLAFIEESYTFGYCTLVWKYEIFCNIGSVLLDDLVDENGTTGFDNSAIL